MFGKKKMLKEKAENLSDYYRKEVMSDEILEFLTKEEFINLTGVAKRADFGIWTAIEAAFCLGYEAGKAGQQNERN